MASGGDGELKILLCSYICVRIPIPGTSYSNYNQTKYTACFTIARVLPTLAGSGSK